MRTSQGSILQSLRAVQGFLDANPSKLGSIKSTGARKNLDEAVLRLESQAAIQTGSFINAKGVTQRKRLLEKELRRDHMSPIARIAKAELPTTPDMRPLRMPHGKPTVEKLVGAANGMADSAAKFADVFISAGLPEDFVARLRAASATLLHSVGERMQHRGQRSGATKGLDLGLKRGRKLVGVIDSLVKTALKDDPALLAEWDVVKRVQLLPTRPSATATQSPATEPAAIKPAA